MPMSRPSATTGGPTEGALALDKGGPHPGKDRQARGRGAHRFVAQAWCHVGAVDHDACPRELRIQRAARPRHPKPADGAARRAPPAVKRTAFQVVVAQRARHGARDRPLAARGGPVDGDDGAALRVIPRASLTPPPAGLGRPGGRGRPRASLRSAPPAQLPSALPAALPAARSPPREFGKVAGKRLAHATRIVDAHRHPAQRGQREAHRHAVVVSIDRRRAKGPRRPKPVGALLHRRGLVSFRAPSRRSDRFP